MRRCPADGTNCYDPACAHGCQGYDISVEAITVVHTRITSRHARQAHVGLVYGGGRNAGKTARACSAGTSVPCGCPACAPALAEG